MTATVLERPVQYAEYVRGDVLSKGVKIPSKYKDAQFCILMMPNQEQETYEYEDPIYKPENVKEILDASNEVPYEQLKSYKSAQEAFDDMLGKGWDE
jgi:hypothetical protein